MGSPEPASRIIFRAILITVGVVLVLWLIWQLRKPISWIIVATFIAVALSGPVAWLERYMRRGFAIAVCYLGLILTPVLLGLIVVPPIVREASDLARNAPEYAADARDYVEKDDRLRKLEDDYGLLTKIEDQAKKLPEKIPDAASALGDIGVRVVNSIFAGITILVLSVFMVGSGGRWIRAAVALQHPERAARIDRALNRMREAVGNYVAGALAQAIIAGILTFIVLKILGVPFAAPLAVLSGLFDLIPLVGATVGAIIVGIVTVFADFPQDTIVWTVWAIVYQQVENTVIQPRIQQRAVDVHPFVVLVAVLFGSTLFGIGGALLAIPVAASAQIVVREWWAYRRERQMSAPPRITPAPGELPPGAGAPPQ